ncbi:hypothetical protein O0L34_g18298 [Tuta absoluta]|nr:hypothetical protein O0L34_g18298 [Tuta absoluta]
MRWFTFNISILLLVIVGTSADWSWGGDKAEATEGKAIEQKTSELLEGEEEAPVAEKKSSESNGTVFDDIVDELVNQKQGRSLGGFNDDVYADPTIKEALDAGDDLEARNLIKERLCNLGLVQCDDEEPQEKRYLSPDELIYAQPVDIKPVGKPIASIPVRGPPRAYGSAKPVYSSRPQKMQPPKRIGYGGNYGSSYGGSHGTQGSNYAGSRPGFSDKYGVANNNFQFSQSQSNSLYGGQDNNYVTRPPSYANDSPYTFENLKPGYGKQPSSQSGSKPEIVQQHVHHHYVHSDDNKDPKVIIKPVAIPVGSIGHLGSQNLAQQSHSEGVITASGFDYGGFKPMTAGYNVDNPETIYGSQSGFNQNSLQSQNLPKPYPGNNFDDQRYGNSLGGYNGQSSQFYKKELHVGGGSANNLFNQGPASFSQSNGYQENYHEAKAQGFECVCVNYDQCPNEEIIGRRDDLYLPIDPRNKGDIAALTEEQLDNLNKTETFEVSLQKNATETETKKVSKREVKQETQANEKSDDEATKEAEPRLLGLAGYGGYGGNGNGNKKVQPTFGVSFGLPQPSHGGYPVNPFHDNPVHNPYGPALNGGGLNLGLISVNPLLSVQVTKDDYGQKVVKPLINLHVTPNEHVVNKLGHLFHEKKHYLLHEHYHHYKPHGYGHHHFEKPIIHPIHPHPPPYYPPPHFPPPHYGPPVYSPHFNHYEPSHFKVHPVQPYHAPETASGSDDYYDDDGEGDQFQNHNVNQYSPNNFDAHGINNGNQINFGNHGQHYEDPDIVNPFQGGFGFERSANITANNRQGYANRYAYSRSLTLPTPSPGANRGGQTVRFPSNRKRREVVEKPVTENVEERQFHGGRPQIQQCRQNQVCCRRPLRPQAGNKGQCGIRHSQGINGRIKTPSYVDGDSEFGEYPWQAAILKKDPKESVYVCGGTLIDGLHIMTAAHCIKSHKAFELRVRLGEWDVNHDVEFYPYIERDVVSVHVHPLYYAGTLDNDLAILKLEHPVEWTKYPHISPACLPDKYTDYAGQRCWTTGWGKDAFGDYGKYQNILKEVDVPVLAHGQCQQQLKQTRLGYNYELNQGFLCAGGEEGKDACKGDGGGPLVCERGGTWQLVGVVSWGIGCGQPGVPGVYVKVAHYLDWIAQVTGKFSPY